MEVNAGGAVVIRVYIFHIKIISKIYYRGRYEVERIIRIEIKMIFFSENKIPSSYVYKIINQN